MVNIKLKNKIIEAELADNLWKHAIGLSFSWKRRNMLFVFPFEGKFSFWMFGMFYPIKIIFLDKTKTVKEIFDARPLSFNFESWRTYKPKEKYRYVLETFEDYKIRKGDKLDFD